MDCDPALLLPSPLNLPLNTDGSAGTWPSAVMSSAWSPMAEKPKNGEVEGPQRHPALHAPRAACPRPPRRRAHRRCGEKKKGGPCASTARTLISAGPVLLRQEARTTTPRAGCFHRCSRCYCYRYRCYYRRCCCSSELEGRGDEVSERATHEACPAQDYEHRKPEWHSAVL